MAPIETPPFYAVPVRPADLGMAAGIVTDAEARVLDDEGRPIPGLDACGNDLQSVMNGAYPGPGITLGPALVFGYVAGRGVGGGRLELAALAAWGWIAAVAVSQRRRPSARWAPQSSR